MSTPVDLVVAPVAEALVACLEQEMARTGSPPRVTCLRPGDRVELLISQNRDECCEGLAWVRLVSMFPSRDFPSQDETFTRCSPIAWALVLELGAARCAPTADPAAVPSCDEWTDTTLAVYDDLAAIRRALLRFGALEDFRTRPWMHGAWTPMTTEGGCVGGAMQVTVSAPACDTLEDA